MNLDRLKEFHILSQNLSFTDTSKILRITPSLLSKHIIALEKSLGVKLLYRSTHSVELTPAGFCFASEVREIVSDCDKLRRQLTKRVQQNADHLSIGFMGTARMNLIGSFLPRFINRHPYIDLEIRVGGSGLIRNMQPGGDLDICFGINASQTCYPGVTKKDIYCDKECLIVSKSHRLAGRDEIDINELNGEVLVMTSENPSDVIQKRTKGMLDTFGLHFARCLSADSIESLLLYVDSGQGVSIFPWKDRGIIFGNTAAIHFSNAECSLTVSLFYRTDSDNPAIETFVSDFDQYSSNNGGQ
jgi:DNA-binding transcriptional LysR family regulator